METTWTDDFYQETDAAKRLELLKQNRTNEQTEADAQPEECREILLSELKNVFLSFIKVSREGRGFTSLIFGMGQLSEEGVSKKIAEQISAIAFRTPHFLHMDKEFALLQEAALLAFRQEYPNREHFLKK